MGKVGRLSALLDRENSSGSTAAVVIQLLALAIGLLAALLVGRIHGLSVAGHYFFYVALQQFFGFAAGAGTSTYGIRRLRRTPRSRLVYAVLVWHFILVASIGAVVTIAGIVFQSPDGSREWILAVVMCFLGLVRQYIEDIAVGSGAYVRGSVIALAENALRFVAVVAFEVTTSLGILTLLCMSTALAFSYTGVWVVKTNTPSAFRRLSGRALVSYYKSAFVMFSSNLVALLQSRLGILVAPSFLTLNQVGLFATIHALSEVPMRIGGTVAKFVYADASIRGGSDGYESASKLIRLSFLVSGLLMVGVISAFPLINLYFYSGSLGGGLAYIIILGFCSLAFLHLNLVANLQYARGGEPQVLVATTFGVSIAGIGCFFSSLFGSLFLLCFSLAVGACVSAGVNQYFLIRR